MKRFLMLLCTLILCICVPAGAAMYVTAEVPELSLTMDFPLSFLVLTRSAEPDDPGLYFYDDDLDTMLDAFVSQDIYLDAIDIDSMLELVILMTPDEETFDLGLHDDAFVDSFAQSLIDAPVWSGDAEVRCFREEDFYQAGARFVAFSRTESQPDVTLSCFQLSTVMNGQAIHLILTDFSGMLSLESGTLAQAMYELAGTLTFTQTLTPDSPVSGFEDVPLETPGASFSSFAEQAASVLAMLVPIAICAVFIFIGRRTAIKQHSAGKPLSPAARTVPVHKPVPPSAAKPSSPSAADPGRVRQAKAPARARHNCSADNRSAPPDGSTETVYCLDCGHKVSIRQQRCPHCGARVV